MMILFAALHGLADRWGFCLLLAGFGFAFRFAPPLRPFRGMSLPACGFLARKLLFFVPICGAVSTVDEVVFWSPEAQGFFVIALGALAAIYGLLRLKDTDRELIPVAAFFLGVALLIGSGWLLPVDGWCHLYMPMLGLFGAAKILLVSPALVWACWSGILIQALNALGSREWQRLVNAVLLGVVLLVSSLSFIAQGARWALPATHRLATIMESAPFRGVSPPQQPPDSGDPPEAPPEAKNFLGLWRAHLAETTRSGVNFVEKEVAPREVLSAIPPLAPAIPFSPDWPMLALVFVATLLGMAGFELPSRKALSFHLAPNAAHGASLTAPDRMRLVDEIRGALAVQHLDGKWDERWLALGTTLLAIGAALAPFAIPALERLPFASPACDFLFALASLAVIPLCMACATNAALSLFGPLRQEIRALSFVALDRRGAQPTPWAVMRIIERLAPAFGRRLVADQPLDVVVSCLTSQSQELRRAADGLLPADAPTDEIRRLAAADLMEARLAAARHPSCDRETLCRLASEAREQDVRQAAMDRLAPATADEVALLLRSQFPDVQRFGVAQSTARRKDLLDFGAEMNTQEDIRRAALDRVTPTTEEETSRLLKSSHPDAHQFAVAQITARREDLIEFAARSQTPAVRETARGRLTALTGSELKTLAESTFADTRAFVIASRTAPRERLVVMAASDSDANLRAAAQQRLVPFSTEELDILIEAASQGVRQYDTRLDVLRFTIAQPAVNVDQLSAIAAGANARGVWQELAAHPLLPGRQCAELISQYLPRSRHVIEKPAEGYESSDNYSTSWVETSPEVSHDEYDENDIVLARRLIGDHRNRRLVALQRLRQLNPELSGLVENG